MAETDAPVRPEGLPDGFEQQSCEAGARRIRYAEAGAGRTLLVIHGGSGWTRNLTSVHAELAESYRIVAPELPGFGQTSGEGIESLRDLASVLADFMLALGVERCSALGSSLGGAVALWLAIDHPSLVEMLILDAPAAFREGAPPPGPPPGTPGAGPPAQQLALMRRILPPGNDPELVAAMPACEVPTLTLLAQDDQFFGTRYASDYRRLPRCTVGIVYQATHDLKESRPEAYLSMTRDFLNRGPGFVVAQHSTLIHA